MRLHKLPVAALIATAALAAAGCGSSSSSSDTPIDATDARLAFEKAAGVKLSDTEFIKDGGKHGLLGSYANIDNVLTDKQMVMLIVLDEAGKANEISEQMQGALPPRPRRSSTRTRTSATPLRARIAPPRSTRPSQACDSLAGAV
jgi:hypothetical protein